MVSQWLRFRFNNKPHIMWIDKLKQCLAIRIFLPQIRNPFPLMKPFSHSFRQIEVKISFLLNFFGQHLLLLLNNFIDNVFLFKRFNRVQVHLYKLFNTLDRRWQLVKEQNLRDKVAQPHLAKLVDLLLEKITVEEELHQKLMWVCAFMH